MAKKIVNLKKQGFVIYVQAWGFTIYSTIKSGNSYKIYKGKNYNGKKPVATVNTLAQLKAWVNALTQKQLKAAFNSAFNKAWN